MHKQAADVTGHISRFCLTKCELRQRSAATSTAQLSGMSSILSYLTRSTNYNGHAESHERIFNWKGFGVNWGTR
jgi:hypothetical protein